MKYGNGITLKDQYELELAELKGLLNEYKVPGEAQIQIIDMITEPYYQLNNSFASGRAMERIIKELTDDESGTFQKYLIYYQEEQQCFPFFDCEEEEDDEE